jgi:hypothetical protein
MEGFVRTREHKTPCDSLITALNTDIDTEWLPMNISTQICSNQVVLLVRGAAYAYMQRNARRQRLSTGAPPRNIDCVILRELRLNQPVGDAATPQRPLRAPHP